MDLLDKRENAYLVNAALFSWLPPGGWQEGALLTQVDEHERE